MPNGTPQNPASADDAPPEEPSSLSASERGALVRRRITTLLKCAAGFLIVLAMIELVIFARFTMHAGVPYVQPSSLTQYFEYGRSVEGKLQRMVRPTDAESHPVVPAGWLVPGAPPRPPAPEGKLVVDVYGMSFALHIADALVELDPRFVVDPIGGPSAPPNFTYAAFEKHLPQSRGDVLVWAILSSSVPYLETLTFQTAGFEQPFPYTYPRYDAVDGELTRVDPAITSLAQMRTALAGPVLWEGWVEQLSAHDPYYSPLTFNAGPLDALASVRLARRAYRRRHLTQQRARVHDRTGFRRDALPAKVLPVLARTFARRARENDRVPVVLLVHDQGFSTHLYELMGAMLEAESIPYFSTHERVSPDDALQFIADGHFQPKLLPSLAADLREVILAEMPPLAGNEVNVTADSKSEEQH